VDRDNQILTLTSRFPLGIQGTDLRFALRLSRAEFKNSIEQLLIEQQLHIDTIHNYETGIFKLKANLVLPKPQLTNISTQLYNLHEVLQQYPQGLTIRELINRTQLSEDTIQRYLIQEIDLAFMDELTDTSFHSLYKTKIKQPLTRLVTSDLPTSLVQKKSNIAFWVGIIIVLSMFFSLL